MACPNIQLPIYFSLNHPANSATTNGGDIDLTRKVTTANEKLLFARIEPGIDTYYQIFARTNGDSTATQYFRSGKVACINSIKSNTVSSFISISSSSPTDNNTKKARIIGRTASSTVVTEDIALNGITAVTTIQSFLHVDSISILQSSTNAEVPAVGDITVLHGGQACTRIPAGYFAARGGISIWVSPTKNVGYTTTNILTPPAGSSFIVRNDIYTDFASIQDLTALWSGTNYTNDYNAIWVKFNSVAGVPYPQFIAHMEFWAERNFV